ncbi:MAG: chemotaxis protein CheA [Paracoccus sp.]|nr:chemotaxis protein CheA [Paracoccus sp. (in: a-proteobacteria)]
MNLPDVTQTFLDEARDLLEQLEAALLDLETNPEDQALINTTFRALHTLKGSGGMFGPPDMAAFAHHLEDVFELVRQGQLPLSRDLVGIFLQSSDLLRRLLFDPVGNHAAETERLIAALAGLTGQSTPHHEGPATSDIADSEVLQVLIQLSLPPASLSFGTNPLALLDELRSLGEAEITPLIATVPDLDNLRPTEMSLHWQIRLTTTAGRTAIDDVFIFVDEPGSVSITKLTPAPQPEIQAVTSPATSAPAAAAVTQAGAEPAESQVRVSAGRLDTLLDQVGELVIAQARLTALAHNRRDPALSAIVEEIERLSADLRDSAMDMRMLPIDQLFSRYRRVVRDLAGSLSKDIELVLSGEDTELDKTVLDRLGDPLVHIIRNSIDHGIETPDQREAAGKPRRGTLRLSARQSGAEMIITVEDDGAGLNRTRIREKALAASVISAEDDLSPAQIDRLIFHPGLSTAHAISNLSGRGVGMDVVKRTITDLQGSIDIASEPGRGTRITLRLPLTLAIIEGLQVAIGNTMCILPLSSVEECLELSAVETRTSSGRNFVDIRGTMVPLLWADRIFGAATAGSVVAVVETDTGKIGVVVDQVIGQHQTVIKPLSPLHRAVPGLAGATILGDGSVALILDVPTLSRRHPAPPPHRGAGASVPTAA